MKLIKILAATVFSSMVATVSVAASSKPVLDIIVPFGSGGSAWIESVMFQEALQKLGYDSEIVHTKNCPNTVAYIKKDTGRPALFIQKDQTYVASKNLNCLIETDDSNYVAPFYQRLQTICSRKDLVSLEDLLNRKKRITVATTNTVPKGSLSTLGNDYGVSVVRVDYDGSGNALKGLIAGDTDLLYTAYTSSTINNQEIKCWATSGNEVVNGLPTMQSLFPNWKLNNLGTFAYMHGVNIKDENFKNQIKQDLLNLLEADEKIKNYIEKSSMTSGTKMKSTTADDFMNSVKIWQGQ